MFNDSNKFNRSSNNRFLLDKAKSVWSANTDFQNISLRKGFEDNVTSNVQQSALMEFKTLYCPLSLTTSRLCLEYINCNFRNLLHFY